MESLKLTTAEDTLAVVGFTDTSIPMGGDVSVLARKTCFCTVAPRASVHSRSVTDDRVWSRSVIFWNSTRVEERGASPQMFSTWEAIHEVIGSTPAGRLFPE